MHTLPVVFLQVSLLAAEEPSGQGVSPAGGASSSNPASLSSQQNMYPGTEAGQGEATEQQSGLAPGAIAGIVIGSVVGAALLAAAAFFGYKKARRHRWVCRGQLAASGLQSLWLPQCCSEQHVQVLLMHPGGIHP